MGLIKLVGIQVDKLIKTFRISLNDISKIGPKLSMSGSRRKAKKKMVDAVMLLRDGIEHQQATDALEVLHMNNQLIRSNVKH